MRSTKLGFILCLSLAGCTLVPGASMRVQVKEQPPVPIEVTAAPSPAPLPTRAPPSATATTTSPPAAPSPEYSSNTSANGWENLQAPTPQPGHFWAPDQPKLFPPMAFGVLQVDTAPKHELIIGAYEIPAKLPQAPAELDVYMAGDYPPGHFRQLKSAMKNYQGLKRLRGWTFSSELALIEYRGPAPLGDKTLVTTPEQARQRATQALQEYGLLEPDSMEATVAGPVDGTWQIFFLQRIDGIPVHVAQALSVTLNREGQVSNVLGRRRPLLARSRYPLRSLQEAWNLLTAGRWLALYLPLSAAGRKDLSGRAGQLDRFVVHAVELAYVEDQVQTSPEVMQPYYAFRNDQGETLYVPAVADPYVNWSQPGP